MDKKKGRKAKIYFELSPTTGLLSIITIVATFYFPMLGPVAILSVILH